MFKQLKSKFLRMWREYQRLLRIKQNGFDTHELIHKYNESIKDAKRYRWLRDNKHLDRWWSVEGPGDRCANIDQDIDNAIFLELLEETFGEEKRPENCRERLKDEGKAYPKSGCNACHKNAFGTCPHK